ncbi:hypothetical protein L195_g012350 [Trifolium pratense]|uniref:Uncharacterized protein n=1 Tax=Trifolium pratense TaxID=57577 RepID=A0A2K3PK33_TRIPR|nr:hypothetical protein L195_g012350 [Trifolium pratense]
MAKHDVSRIYEALFTKLGLQKKDLVLYKGTYLQGFNGSTTRPWGFLDVPVTFWDGKKKDLKRTINVQFFVVSRRSVYNCILGKPTFATLGAVPSTVHLKMKYTNAKDEVVTIDADLEGAQKVHKNIQRTINIAAKGE